MQVKKQQLEPDMEQQTASKLGKEYVKAIGKDSDAGNEWRREEKGTTDDEMIRWHHWLNEHEFE